MLATKLAFGGGGADAEALGLFRTDPLCSTCAVVDLPIDAGGMKGGDVHASAEVAGGGGVELPPKPNDPHPSQAAN